MPTLHWIGKEKVINHHRDVPFKVLQHKYGFDNGKQSEKPTNSGNLIIHGDNLEALKALLPQYEGKVDCICIDPPYNTGNENWIYNDNVNHPKIKKWLGDVVGKEGDDLSRHDKWLCMMYPRLKLLKQLLTKEGKLVISISHHEVFNLILVLKELFGEKQITCVTVQTSGGKPSSGFNYQHEYLIFIVPINFKANPMNFTGGKKRTPFEGLTLATFDKTQRPNQTYPIFINKETGLIEGVGESLQEKIKNNKYNGSLSDYQFDFNIAPENTVAIWPITSKGKECVWRLQPSRLLSDWEKGYIKVTPNKQKTSLNLYSIQYLPEGIIKKIQSKKLDVIGTEDNNKTLLFGENLTEGNDIPTIWTEKDFFSVKGTTLLNEIFGKKKFDYPKPLSLIVEILRSLTSKNDIILDSFAGSNSTSHATLFLNDEDGGDRKFISIEMEDYAEEVTVQRIKKIINGYNDLEGINGSFDFYELGLPIFVGDNNEYLNEAIDIEQIREYIWFSETRTPYLKPTEKDSTYFLGKKEDSAYYFIYEKETETTLDYDMLSEIKTKSGQYVIYADNCLLSKEFMMSNNIIFKKIPRDVTRF